MVEVGSKLPSFFTWLASSPVQNEPPGPACLIFTPFLQLPVFLHSLPSQLLSQSLSRPSVSPTAGSPRPALVSGL